MNLPFDFEDVVGVAVADVLRRVGLILLVLIGASLAAGLGLLAGEWIASLVEFGAGGVTADLGVTAVVWLSPVFSGWGLIYLPLLLGICLYCVKADSPSLKVLAGCIAAVAALQILGARDPEWFGLRWSFLGLGTAVADPEKLRLIRGITAVPVALSGAGALWFVGLLLENRRERLAQEHLIGESIENQRRRDEQDGGGSGIVIDGGGEED